MKIYTAVNGAGETLAVSDRLYDVTKVALGVINARICSRIFDHIEIFEGETLVGAICTTEVNGHVTARFVEEKPTHQEILAEAHRVLFGPSAEDVGAALELPKPEQPSEIQLWNQHEERINEQWKRRAKQAREQFRMEVDQWHRRWRAIQELMERAKTLVNFDLKNAIYPDSRREFEEYRTVIAGAIEYIESVARDELP